MNNFFGENLKKAREKCGFTQDQLAYKLNISPSTIGMYEQGRREPDFNNLVKMSDILHTSISELLGIKEKFYLKSTEIDKVIPELVNFIENQDYIFFKGEKLNIDEINNILYVLRLIVK